MADARRFSFTWLIVALAMAEVTCSFESGMVYVALSPLYREYGDPVKVGWLVTAFTLASAGSAAVGGRLGDIYGRRKVLLIMLSVALGGSILSGLGPNLDVVIAGRALQGCSTAILPLAFGILRENCSDTQVTRGVGLLGGAYAVGAGLGLVLGGVIVDHLPWQWIFACSVIGAALALLLTLAFVPASPVGRRPERIDILGGVLFVPGVAAILLAIATLSDLGWRSIWPQALAAGGVLSLILWTRHELRQQDPLIDVKLLRDRRILCANLCIFFTAVGPMLFPVVIVPLLQQPVWTGVGFGVSATMAGLIKLPANLMCGVAVTAGGQIATRTSVRSVLIAAAALLMVSWASMAVFYGSFPFVVVMLILILAPAASVLFSLVPRIIMDAAPQDRTSEATGLTQVIRAVGQAIASQVLAFLLATSLVKAPGVKGSFPTEIAYVRTFLYMSGFSILAIGALVALARGVPRPRMLSRAR